jgi:hypothetical protein
MKKWNLEFRFQAQKHTQVPSMKVLWRILKNIDPSESQVETSSTIGGGEDNGTFFRGNCTSR